MAKGGETFEHTADIGIKAWGDTREELYEALAEALAELICPRRQVGSRDSRRLVIDSRDPGALAVDFLTAMLSVAQAERMCFADVAVQQATDTHLEATVRGERADPSRHDLGAEIKAVTYHMLEVRRDGTRWTGRVLLDL